MNTANCTVKVPVLPDLANISEKIDSGLAVRKKDYMGPGATTEQRVAAYGVDADFFDGDASASDRKAAVALAESNPWKLIEQMAAEGAKDTGGSLVKTESDFPWFGGKLTTTLALLGTAKEDTGLPLWPFDNKKVAGAGAQVRGQVVLSFPGNEIVSVAQAFQMRLDKDALGKELPPQARLNIDGTLAADGLRDVSLSAVFENLPAFDLNALIEEAGNESLKIKYSFLFKILADLKSQMSMSVANGEASLGVRTNLGKIEEIEELAPDMIVSLGGGAKTTADGMIDLGEGAAAIESKMNFLKAEDGTVKMQYQDRDGNYVDYNPGFVIEPQELVEWMMEFLS